MRSCIYMAFEQAFGLAKTLFTSINKKEAIGLNQIQDTCRQIHTTERKCAKREKIVQDKEIFELWTFSSYGGSMIY